MSDVLFVSVAPGMVQECYTAHKVFFAGDDSYSRSGFAVSLGESLGETGNSPLGSYGFRRVTDYLCTLWELWNRIGSES